MNQESAPSGSVFAQLANLFVAPAQALDYADRRPQMLWLPLGVNLSVSAALGILFALTVNLAAWRAAMVRIAAAANPEAASRVAEFYTQHGRGMLLAQFAGGGVIGLAIIELLFALYLFFADKLFSADSRGYGRWLSFTAWTWLPLTVGYIASIIAWALSSHSSNFGSVDVTTLNSLFFHLPMTSRYHRLTQFSILQFWIIGLTAFGLKRWCRHGTGKALAIALAPYIVVYGIMFLL